MIDWTANLTALIDGLESGLKHHADRYGEPVVGPIDFGKISYPAVHVIPDTSNHQGGNEYQHTGFVNFYFQRESSSAYRTRLTLVGKAMQSVMDHLESDPQVVTFKPTRVEHYAGATPDTLVLKIEVEYTATTLVDFAES